MAELQRISVRIAPGTTPTQVDISAGPGGARAERAAAQWTAKLQTGIVGLPNGTSNTTSYPD